MTRGTYFLPILLMLCLGGFSQQLIDPKADGKTKNLYKNLHTLASNKTLFGHQDDVAYGVKWWARKGRSDVREIVGSYPAVHGWDIAYFGQERNIDSVLFDDMKRWMKEVYTRGGINTISWHMANPATGGDAWDTSPAVKDILEGGEKYIEYLKRLDDLAVFALVVKGPVLFRPFHEHNGDWFWWGQGNASEEDYIALWQQTVKYLRDVKKVHNFIYVFSPDRKEIGLDSFEKDYLYGYPGDEYVDVLGLDNYLDLEPANDSERTEMTQNLTRSLSQLDMLAKKKGKLAALTETGQEGMPEADWFSSRLIKGLEESKANIAYALLWRNTSENHHFAPYDGHPTAADFRAFRYDPRILFENDLEEIYKKWK